MNILIDILHPAHVHFFKNYIWSMQEKGHSVYITSRKKDVTTDLLDYYGFDHYVLSSIGNNKIELIKEFFVRFSRLLRIVCTFKPDIMLGIMGAFVAPAGKLCGVPSLVFYDTETASLTNWYVYRTCTRYITPHCYRDELGDRQIRYKSFHERAYIDQAYYTPDSRILDEIGITEGTRFTLVRFVSWGASHDIGHSGISKELKIEAVRRFEKYGKVFISSETPLPKELEQYRLSIPVGRLHSLLYYATLIYGESATLVSEGANAGTFGIYLDSKGRGYTDKLEEFGIVKNFSESIADQKASIIYAERLLGDKDAKTKSRETCEKMRREYSDDINELMQILTVRYAK